MYYLWFCYCGSCLIIVVCTWDFGGLLFWFNIGLDDCLWMVGGLRLGLYLGFCDLMFVSLDGFVMVALVVIGLVQAVVLL